MRVRLPAGFLPDDVLVKLLQGLIARQDTSGHLPAKVAEILYQLTMKSFEMATLRDQDDAPGFFQAIPNQGYRQQVKPCLFDAARHQCSNDVVDNLIGSPFLY